MHWKLTHCEVRTFRPSDAGSLTRHANDRDVWLNLRDRFPHPYARSDAEAFIAMALEKDPPTMFAIVVDDEACGAIGFQPGTDVERVGAEIGYWLARVHWGRGITTEALGVVSRYAIERFELTRVFALPFATNPASVRVLEKAGYQREGRLRRSAIKDGRVVDQLQYAFVPETD